jgi:hypothetical protein
VLFSRILDLPATSLSNMTANDMTALVEAEIAKIMQPDLVTRIRELLVPVRCELRGWDYGKIGDEEFPCWIFAEHPQSNTAFAYSEHGFGPSSPWGLLFIRGKYTSMGMDSGWFVSLEDLFRESMAWDGANPPDYTVG